MALPVTITCIPAGRSAIDLTPFLDGSPRFATAAVGGFADASFTLRGDQRSKVPYLAVVRISYDTVTLYEGQVEDADPSGGPDDVTTSVTCFGLRNLLTETSVRRIWSKRDLDWQQAQVADGATIGLAGTAVVTKRSNECAITIGHFDATDLTKVGVRASGQGVAMSAVAADANVAEVYLPSGVTIARILATITLTGANTGAAKLAGYLQTIKPGAAVGADIDTTAYTASTSVSQAVGSDHTIIRLGAFAAGAVTPTVADTIDWTDIRILGTSLSEDVADGFYGGTILRDLIALIPGLTPGLIEDGSDFTIQAIERSVRDSALSVVEEVAGYYTREYAIWENGSFDWKARALDIPDWLTTTTDFTSLSIKGTLDGIARTVYILYTDAASGLDAEATAASTAQRNPYVKQGRPKDLLISPGFPMTANTSQQLATRIAGDVGQWVPVTGTITLPATKIIPRAIGGSAPAAAIRAGDNIAITDLPKTDLFTQGRDGETLFHIVGTDCDLAHGTVTLELEGQSSRADVIIARLAAVTRTLTG